MSNNKWVEHVKAYAKQHGLSYMRAATEPNCSKTYKEKQNPTTKTKAITAPAAAKTAAPKSESSSTTGNTFKEIDINNIPRSKTPFYVYVPWMAYLKSLKLENLQKQAPQNTLLRNIGRRAGKIPR